MKFRGLLIAVVIAATGYFGYQHFLTAQGNKNPECVNSRLPPDVDGKVYELKFCIIDGKEVNITFPDELVGKIFPVDFWTEFNCERLILAKAGETVPKNLKSRFPTKSSSEKVVIGRQGKTCQTS